MKIFIDVDSTIVDSLYQLVKYYNDKYDENIKYTDVKSWNLEECDKLINPVDEIMEMFDNVKFYKTINWFSYAKETIETLAKRYDVYFVTIGKPECSVNKIRMLSENFPLIPQIILVQDNPVMNKSIVNMENGILIDDHSKNLISSNARYKILFQPAQVMNYNKEWTGEVAKNWVELEQMIEDIVEMNGDL